MPSLKDLKITIFADEADLDSITEAYQEGLVRGFTTNPTLMAKAGITSYMTFAREFLRIVPDLPVSFEVFSDDFEGMHHQARKLNALADNVYVKIPITNTTGASACPLIKTLAGEGMKLNVTAMLTLEQVRDVAAVLQPDVPALVSVFAGRIADTGVDPLPLMKEALELLKPLPAAELLWASPREFFNIIQAEQIGCHVITVVPAILAKAKFYGMALDNLSLETVKMFYNDASHSGFKILDGEPS